MRQLLTNNKSSAVTRAKNTRQKTAGITPRRKPAPQLRPTAATRYATRDAQPKRGTCARAGGLVALPEKPGDVAGAAGRAGAAAATQAVAELERNLRRGEAAKKNQIQNHTNTTS